MKYILVVGDGMADYPVPELGNKTPLQAAYKPNMDSIAAKGKAVLSKLFLTSQPQAQKQRYAHF